MADNRLTLVLRTRLDVATVARQIGAIVKRLDPGVPVHAVTTLDHQLRRSKAVFSRELPMILCGVFGAAALAITLVALYAISLHDVLARRREFGIRLALGAAPKSIRRLILKDAMLVSAAGIAAGAIMAVLVTRSMQAVLFDIGASDWRVLAAVIAGVLAAAMLAVVGPVRRAGAVNLGLVLRAE
jgi:ABC-type antimicrobial peptide transport system permease subunit